jgi:hypothetical protein
MKYLLAVVVLAAGPFSYAQQDTTRDYAAELAALEAELDSMSIFSLIDSILGTEVSITSELNIRLGYTSNVLNAGRNYGINQHGLSPGVSFYHKSGFYSDIAGFWNSDYEPSYNLTMATIGYMGTIKNTFTYTGSYERWIYNISEDESEFITLRNSAGASFGADFKWIFGNIDYSFLFGDETAHRVIGSVAGRIRWRNVLFLDAITIYPTISALFGNETVTIRFTDEIRERVKFTDALDGVELTNREFLLIRQIRQRLRDGEITRQRADQLINAIFIRNPEVQENLNQLLTEENNVFGIMNYSFSLPVTMSLGRWTCILNYSYNIPINLPGEEIELEPIGFFGATVSYRVPFR